MPSIARANSPAMRAILAAGIVLLAGCTQANPLAPKSDISVFAVCPRVELASNHSTIQTATQANITYRITNCSTRNVEYLSQSCHGSGFIVDITGQSLHLQILENGLPMDTPWKDLCQDPYTNATLSPNETLERPAFFSGAYSHCDAGVCDFGSRWAPPGDYNVSVTFRDVNGTESRANGTITLTPPALPSTVPDGDVVFVMNRTYHYNETIDVRVANHGNVTYGYSTYYAACGTQFYDHRAYPFRIPPGTHCDLANTSPLQPNETIILFTWHLDVCTSDMWGCAASEPLPVGEYHVRFTLTEYHDFGSADDGKGKNTTAEWDFSIVPAT